MLFSSLMGEATSVSKQPYKQLILGETWNAVAPTGSSWRNWPRGSSDFMAMSPPILGEFNKGIHFEGSLGC